MMYSDGLLRQGEHGIGIARLEALERTGLDLLVHTVHTVSIIVQLMQ